MAKYGSYGWSPKQMERINARRAERGQEELRNLRYEDRPQNESRRTARQMPDQIEDEDEVSLKQRTQMRNEDFQKRFSPRKSMRDIATERTAKFKGRFSAPGAMGIKARVSSEAAKLKRKKLDEDSPILTGSYERILS